MKKLKNQGLDMQGCQDIGEALERSIKRMQACEIYQDMQREKEASKKAPKAYTGALWYVLAVVLCLGAVLVIAGCTPAVVI